MKLLLTLLLIGCASKGSLFPGYIPYEGTNRASLPFSIEGMDYRGTATVQRKSSQNIKFKIPKGTIKFMIATCSREEFFAYPESDIKYTYIPIMFLENLDSCIMKATAITNKGETITGIIDFTAGEQLKGELSCNGQVYKSTGAGFCQSRQNLIQNIEFSEETVFAFGEGCNEPKKGYISTSYNISLSKGFCTYQFMNKDKETYRLTTYGYDSIEEVK